MRAPLAALLLLLALLPVSLATSTTASTGETWQITEDTTLRTERTVTGDIEVLAPATLTIDGTTLSWTGNLTVAKGARLVLGETSAATLQGMDGTASMRIDGSLDAGGAVPTTIRGLGGKALAPFVAKAGGLQVTGNATLDNVLLEESSGFMVVHAGGLATIRHSTLRNLGDALLGVQGTLDLSDSILQGGRLFGLVLRDTCDAQVRNVTIQSSNTPVVVGSCQASFDRLGVEHGNSDMEINGGATVSLSNSTLAGYVHQAIRVRAVPEQGQFGHPQVKITDTTFVPTPKSKNGIVAEGARVALERLALDGHQQDGLRATSSTIGLANVRLAGNLGYGANLTQVTVGSDALLAVDYGAASGIGNGRGAVRDLAVIKVAALDDHGQVDPNGFHLIIRDGQNNAVVDRQINGTLATPVSFDLYSNASTPAYLGPFTYTAEWANGARRTGVVESDDLSLVFKAQPSNGPNWVLIGAVGGTVALMALVAYVKRRR